MKKAVIGALLVISSFAVISCNDTTGYTCSDPEDSNSCDATDESIIYCIKNDLSDSYYKVGDKKFNCNSGSEDCAEAVAEYCNPNA